MSKSFMSKVLPFGVLPGHWGLRGDTRKRAKLEYEMSGYDLEVELARLDHKDIHAFKAKLADIDYTYNKISKYDRDRLIIENSSDSNEEKELKILDLDLAHHKIEQVQYEKAVATIKKEPWVNVVRIEIDKNMPVHMGNLELDWNDYFIEELRANNYVGTTDDELINQWLTMLCSTLIAENGMSDTSFIPNRQPVVKEEQKPKRGKGNKPVYREYE